MKKLSRPRYGKMEQTLQGVNLIGIAQKLHLKGKRKTIDRER